MAIKKKLPADLRRTLARLANEDERVEMKIRELSDLRSALEEWAEEQDEARSERSDAWLESSAAEAHQAFLDRVIEIRDVLAEALDGIENADLSEPEYEA